MSPIRSVLFALGFAIALSSCGVFKKDQPVAQDPYAAANPYATGATGTPAGQNQGYPAYGNPSAGGYDAGNPSGQPAAGSYAQPNYNQPYSQPAAGTYAGNAPGYSTGNPGGNPGAASGSGRTHKVNSGDTLSGIGRRYGVSVDSLMRANNLNSTLIKQGGTLNIP